MSIQQEQQQEGMSSKSKSRSEPTAACQIQIQISNVIGHAARNKCGRCNWHVNVPHRDAQCMWSCGAAQCTEQCLIPKLSTIHPSPLHMLNSLLFTNLILIVGAGVCRCCKLLLLLHVAAADHHQCQATSCVGCSPRGCPLSGIWRFVRLIRNVLSSYQNLLCDEIRQMTRRGRNRDNGYV